MADAPPQLWQPHDRPTGELRRWRVPTGLAGAGGELVLDVTAESEVTADVVPLEPGVAEVRLRPAERGVVRAGWQLPATDLVSYWRPDGDHRGLPPYGTGRRPRRWSGARRSGR